MTVRFFIGQALRRIGAEDVFNGPEDRPCGVVRGHGGSAMTAAELCRYLGMQPRDPVVLRELERTWPLVVAEWRRRAAGRRKAA